MVRRLRRVNPKLFASWQAMSWKRPRNRKRMNEILGSRKVLGGAWR